MNVFLVDLTHGGVKISTELAKSKKYDKIFAYDLYKTLKSPDEDLLKRYDVKVIKSLDNFKASIKLNSGYRFHDLNQNDYKDLIINPIHSSLNISELLNEISDELELNENEKSQFIDNFNIINHHEATRLVLSDWKEKTKKENVNCIELTGVKGKTSVVFLLKEIMMENKKDTLILSSLGDHLFKNNNKDIVLMKNISITPANIINTIQYANKIVNPKCSPESKYTDKNQLNYQTAIFENSLGVCGLGDIGILTNIVENYPIAKGSSNAREAKKQAFNCPLVVIEKETLNQDYPNESIEFNDKINSFSIDDDSANLFAKNIDYDLDNTKIEIEYHDLKMITPINQISEKRLNGKLTINSFAPGKHHVLNILASVTSALALGIDNKTIKKGLSNFKGIKGRTHIRKIKDSVIIEEINPGINTKAIESSINMIKNINDYYIIIGGKYGVTCEEIDEEKLSNFLNSYLIKNTDVKMIFTDELGLSIKERLDKLNETNLKPYYNIKYIENYEEAQKTAVLKNKNILFIYRSNYSQVSKR